MKNTKVILTKSSRQIISTNPHITLVVYSIWETEKFWEPPPTIPKETTNKFSNNNKRSSERPKVLITLYDNDGNVVEKNY